MDEWSTNGLMGILVSITVGTITCGPHSLHVHCSRDIYTTAPPQSLASSCGGAAAGGLLNISVRLPADWRLQREPCQGEPGHEPPFILNPNTEQQHLENKAGPRRGSLRFQQEFNSDILLLAMCTSSSLMWMHWMDRIISLALISNTKITTMT